MVEREKPEPRVRDLARDIAKDSIVTMALSRLIEQIMEEVHETQIRPLRSALQDAINSPKGVVPKSAETFWDGRAGKVK